MTTTLIPSTSSAPTLRERAHIAAEERSAHYAAEQAESQRRDTERRLDVLRIHLRDKLGVNDGVTVAEVAEAKEPGTDYDIVDIRATVDGLTFGLRDIQYNDAFGRRDRLHVLAPCAKECGKELWVHVETLEDLDRAFSDPTAHTFACLQQFDEEGEPTTDREGNPLPPRKPFEPQLSPEQSARASIAAIEAAATWVADALNNVARLEDDRAAEKAAAIVRLMATPNPLTGKQHSASSAEAVVETDEPYAAHRAKQLDAEVVRWASLASWEAAKLTAQLDVQLVTRNSE